MNYYEHHLGDYYRKTSHLTLLEHGVYRRLLHLYYIHEAPLSPKIEDIQRLVGARTKKERDAVETIVNEFFTLADDGWHNSRCDEEIGKHHKKMASLRDLQNRDEYRQHRSFVLMRDGFACVYCGNTKAPLQLDHVIPRSRGGTDTPDNLAAACRSCNQRKGAKTPEEWFHV